MKHGQGQKLYSECSSIPRLSKDSSMLFPKHYICEMGISRETIFSISLGQTRKLHYFPARGRVLLSH